MIKISVVGLGQMGVNHLNNLLNIKNINLINIYDKIKKKKLENKYKTKFSNNIKKQKSRTGRVSLDLVPQRVGILLKANVQGHSEDHPRDAKLKFTVGFDGDSPVKKGTRMLVRCMRCRTLLCGIRVVTRANSSLFQGRVFCFSLYCIERKRT